MAPPQSIPDHVPLRIWRRENHGRESVASFRGTGFCVGPQLVLTCCHVLTFEGDGHDRDIQEQTNAYEFSVDQPGDTVRKRIKKVLASSPHHKLDLALLQVDDLSGSVLPLVAGWTPEFMHRLSELVVKAIGYAAKTDAEASSHADLQKEFAGGKFREIYEKSDGIITYSDLQVAGSLREGMSGGPIVGTSAGGTGAIGIAYLGGERSATSRFVLSPKIAQFLRAEAKNIVDRVEFVPASTLLRPLAEVEAEVIRNYRKWAKAKWDEDFYEVSPQATDASDPAGESTPESSSSDA